MNQQVDLGIWHRLSQMVVGLIILASIIGVFFWYLPVFQQNARMRKEILTLENQIRVEETKQERLIQAIHAVQTDPKTVERIARQKLGYAKPGETVIYFDAPVQPAVTLRPLD